MKLIVSERDARRLKLLIQARKQGRNGVSAENLHRLELELERARIVPDDKVPEDVVTMDSTVELEDIQTGELMTYTLVFPERTNITLGLISVLAPLGTAILGYREGDEFRWPVPGGMLSLKICRVKQQQSAKAWRPDTPQPRKDDHVEHA